MKNRKLVYLTALQTHSYLFKALSRALHQSYNNINVMVLPPFCFRIAYIKVYQLIRKKNQKGREEADLNAVRENELQATPSSFKSTSGREGALANNVPSCLGLKRTGQTLSYASVRSDGGVIRVKR